jgi:MYXO-CTERM domain-containing protein
MTHPLMAIVPILAILAMPLGALAQSGAVATPAVSPAPASFEIIPEPGDDPGVTARGYFVYSLPAGEEESGSLAVRNPGDVPVTIHLAAVDALTAQGGGSAFAAADAAPETSGSWLRLEEPRVELAAGEQTSVGFSVHPPVGTAPGQYLAGIAAFVPVSPNDPGAAGADQTSALVTVQTRYVIGVQVEVPGEWTPSLEITGASVSRQPGGARLGVVLRNDGDIFLRPKGAVTLTDAAGRQVLSEPFALDTFLTGTDYTHLVAWPGTPLEGEYGVEIELNYADDGVARYSGSLVFRDDTPVVQPAPQEGPRRVATPLPAAAASAVESAPAPSSPWIVPIFIGLLLLAVLLGLVLTRIRRNRW